MSGRCRNTHRSQDNLRCGDSLHRAEQQSFFRLALPQLRLAKLLATPPLIEKGNKMNLENEIKGSIVGMIQGRRIYKVKRGHYQVQDVKQPNKSAFDGTLRECENALHGKLMRFEVAKI